MRFTDIRDFLRRFSRYRSIRVTPEGLGYTLVTLGVGVAAMNTGHNLLYLLFAMMLSLIVISGFLSELSLKRLEIRRRLPPEIFANHPATAALVIANRKQRASSFSLRLMDVVDGTTVDRGIHLLHLRPASSICRSYPLLLTRRGRYRLEGVKILTRFPFGLFAKTAMLSLPSDVVVYPAIRMLPDPLARELEARGHGWSLPLRGQGTGLYNLRLYQPGDDSRTIHWKTSARDTRLIVRETEADDQRRVTVILHTHLSKATLRTGPAAGSPMHPFELAVELVASLTAFFCRRNYELRLFVGEQALPYGMGEAHLSRMLHLLALCGPTILPEEASGNTVPGHPDGKAVDGACTIVVMAEADPSVMDRYRGASRILIAPEVV